MDVSAARLRAERGEAEFDLLEAELPYRLLVEQIPAVVYVEALDRAKPETRMLYISPQIEPMLGYSVDEWLNEPLLW